ncbi:Ig-like domain-containing protein [Methylobacterium oxalidis]|nr:Ig-like domain-containing protein [Methylobacterium oxalidis]
MATIQTFDGLVGTSGNPVTIGGYTYALRTNGTGTPGSLRVETEFGDAVLNTRSQNAAYLSIAQASGGAFDLDGLTLDRDISLLGDTVFVGYRNGVQVATASFINILTIGDQTITLGSEFDNVTEVRVFSRSALSVNLGVGFAIDDVRTNDTTPPAAPTITAGVAATADNTPTITGTAEIGSTVTIRANGAVIGTAAVGANGAYSFTPTTPLADNTYTLTATATDASGNAGPASAGISLRVDATAPAAPAFTAGGGVTNDNTPTVTGTAEAGATVTVLNGTTVVGTAVAGANGVWTLTSGTLGDGTYNLTATARDSLGNTSVASAPLGLTIDTAAPGAPTVTAPALTNSATPTVTGTAEAGATVTLYNGATVLGTAVAGANGAYAITPTTPLTGGSFSLTATATDRAGNVSGRSGGASVTVDLTAPTAPTLSAGTAATGDNTPTLTGTAEPGATVTISNGATILGTAVAGANGAYSFTPTVPLADGTYALTATARDAAGNLGPASTAVSLRIDATAPGAPTFVAGGGLTGDSTPTVTGTAEAGATVTILNGTTVLGTAVAGTNGVFTFTPTTPLAEGAYTLTAVARDAVGNASPASAPLALQLDLTAPGVPAIAPLAPTNDNTPTITGTADAGTLVTISNGATVLGTATAGADGTFSFTPGTALPDGTASLTATARDAAGNVSGPSAAVSLVVDTGLPAAPVLAPIAPTRDDTPTITGTAEPGAVVTILSGTTVLGTATADPDGSFSFTPATALPNGTTSLTAVARDAAGNASPASAAVSLTVDTLAPAAPVLAPLPLTADDTPTITGTAEPGALVTISNGTTVLGTATAGPNGTFAFTPATALPDGTASLTATAQDAAGNLSPVSAAIAVTVDTTAPGAPVIAPLDPTNDTTPTITGTAEPGALVTISNGAAVLGTATAGLDGTFSFTPTTPLTPGTASLTATAQDAAGNTSPVSATVAVTIDTAAPTAPVIDPLPPTNDTTPTITGTAEPGAVVTISNGATVLGTATAGPDGTFSVTPAAPLAPGSAALTATAQDAAGNTSPASAAVTLTIDTAAPGAPVIAPIAPTNDTTPTITGTAEAGATVTVTAGATVLGTAVADAQGNFSLTPTTPLTDGTASLTATARDVAGNLSAPSAAVTVTIDTLAPGAPTIDAVPPGSDVTPTITGTAEPGAVVTVTSGTTVLGTATAGAGGTFTLTPTVPLPNGDNPLVATARDAAGNISAPSATVIAEIDTTVPGAPILDDLAPTNDPTPVVTGLAGANDTVTVFLGTTPIGTGTAGPDGAFSIEVSALPDGINNLTVVATSPTGVESDAAPLAVLVDTVTPVAPVLAAFAGPTNDNTPTIRGTAEAGTTVTISNGAVILGTVVADATGAFAFTPASALADGPASLTATATDVAGNESVASVAVTVTVDTGAPPAPALDAIGPTNDNTPTITGSAEAGSTVTVTAGTTVLGTAVAGTDGRFTITPTTPLADGTASLTATARDAAGNLSPVSAAVTAAVDTAAPAVPVITTLPGTTDDSTPVIAGTAEPNAVLTFRNGDTVIGTAAADAAGNFTFTPGTNLPEGTASITVTAADAAGNVSAPSLALALEIDTTAPAAPVLTIAPGTTGDSTPTITGTAEAGATVAILSNGTQIGAATADAQGNFSFTPGTALPDGSYTFTAAATDAAGNAGPASAAIGLTVDTGIPAAPTLTIAAGPTNDATPAITGTAEPNALVTISNGATTIGTVAADASGNFSFTPATALGDGPYTLTATATDAAGQVSPASAAVAIVVDTAAPSAPTVSSPGGPVADATPAITGTGEPGATVTLLDGGTAVGTGTVAGDGTFTVSPTSPLGQGPHNLTVQLTDAAGNVGAASAPVSVVVDTLPPAAPVITTAAGTTGDSTPTIAGTAEPGATVAILSNGTQIGAATADAQGNFSFTPGTALPDGSYTFTAAATDAAGNAGPASAAIGLTVDTGIPAAPTLTIAAGPTNDATPAITGTAEPNALVTISNGATTIGTVAADASGNFSFTPATALGDGPYTLTATATDAAGQVSPASAAVAIVVDTAAPSAPTVSSPGGPVADATPAITGTGEPGATVTLLDGGTAVGTGTVAGDGTFTVSPTSPLGQGPHNLTVQLTDAAGNVGAASAPVSVVVDTLPPAAPVITTAAGTTGDSTPTIAGTAEPGAMITVSNGGTVLGTTMADVSGNWSFTPGTALGDGAAQITATATDAAGNAGAASAPLALVVDTAAPAAPTVTSPGGPTADTTPAITGTGEAGATVTLLDGGNPVGTGTVGQDGTFTVSPTNPLGEGPHNLTVQLTDAAGNVGAPSNPVSVVIDTSIDTGTPAAFTVDATADGVLNAAEAATTGFTVSGLDAGTTAAATFTDGTRVVSVPVSADGTYAADLSSLNGPVTTSLLLSDAAGNSATVAGPSLSLDTLAPAGSAAADTAGGPAATSFTVTVTFPETVTGLGAEDFVLTGTDGSAGTISGVTGSGGSYTVTVTNVTGSGTLTLSLAPGSDIADAAGNLASLTPASRVVDIPAPGEPPPTVIAGFSADSGLVGDGITNDATPVLAGTGIAGGVVTVTFTDASGPRALTAAIDQQGNWNLALPSLADGNYSFTASAIGPNGETTDASAPLALTIDTTADAVPTVNLVVSEPASGVLTPAEAASTAFTISGLDAGSVATVTFTDGTRSVQAAAQSDGSYTVDLSSFSGTVTSSIVITDVAGNTAAGSGNAVDVDQGGAQPADLVTPLISGIEADTGTPGDAITSDTTPTVTGLGTPGTTVVLRYTDATGPRDLTGTVAADGSWQIGLPTLPDGTYDIVATGRDAQGNVSAPSQPLRVVVDTVADAGAPVALGVDPAPGGTASAAEAANTAFTVSGLDGDATATVTFTDGTNSVTVQAGADGRYTADLSGLNGTVTSSLVSTDAAGNTANAAGPSIVIDNVAPAAPVVDGTSGGTTTDSSPVLSGSAEPGSTVTVTYGTPQGPGAVTGTTGTDGRWSIEVPPLPDGTYTFTVDATDTAGNRGASGTPIVLTIDAVPDPVNPDPANIAPVGTADAARTTAHALAITGNVLANDSDANAGDTLRVTGAQFEGGLGRTVSGDGSVEVVGNFGTLTVRADGSYSYQAIGANSLNAGATAVEHFTYTVSDARGGLAQARLDITVGGEVPRAEQSFGFAFTDAKVSLDGESLVLVGPDGVVHDVTGIDTLRFTDGTIQNNDNYRAVDDIYYYAKNLDVWRAGIDADDHFAVFGWKEGRDPNAFFHTAEYLAENRDVAAAGVNPLSHYIAYGEREGRSPSEGFSAESYYAQNPDVQQAGFNALAHYLAFGQDEGRSVLAGEGPRNVTGDFDPTFYLAANPDVAAATPAGRAADSWALQHYLTYGAKEGRDPNAFFDTSYYLEQNPDVAASGMNPMLHYQEFGWREGRDPSPAFDTNAYLASHPDVAQAQIDPLEHFLQFGGQTGSV